MSKQEEIEKFISQYLRNRFTPDETPEDECDAEARFIMNYLREVESLIEDK